MSIAGASMDARDIRKIELVRTHLREQVLHGRLISLVIMAVCFKSRLRRRGSVRNPAPQVPRRHTCRQRTRVEGTGYKQVVRQHPPTEHEQTTAIQPRATSKPVGHIGCTEGLVGDEHNDLVWVVSEWPLPRRPDRSDPLGCVLR